MNDLMLLNDQVIHLNHNKKYIKFSVENCRIKDTVEESPHMGKSRL